MISIERRAGALLLAAGLGVFPLARAAAPLLPLDDFTRQPDADNLQLSPDGKTESFIRRENGHPTVFTRATDSSRGFSFDLGRAQLGAQRVQEDVLGYRWIANDRLLITTGVWNFVYGTVASNLDGGQGRAVSGLELLGQAGVATRSSINLRTNVSDIFWAFRTLHVFGDAERSVLMLDEHDYDGRQRLSADVVRVGTLNGTQNVVAKNPGNVFGWGCDHDGQVRIGFLLGDDDKWHAIYRDSDRDAWRPVSFPESLVDPSPIILGFDRDNRHYFINALSPERKDAIYRLDAKGEEDPSLVASDPAYDIVPRDAMLEPAVGSVSLTQIYFSKRKRSLVGIAYVRDGPRTHWLDPEFDRYQQLVDHALPTTVNHCVAISDDDRRLVFFCFSDRDPGTYVLLDADRKAIVPLERRAPWLHPEDMARTFPVRYRARDGLDIPAYLTIPVGAKPAHLPLVVMPHGGPWVRDVWGFDPLVQFLANRGYAVLQPNFRGSPGFGRPFHTAGLNELGGAIQRDIEDAVRWAIAGHLADRNRIAILGASFGGYCALYGAGKTSGLYRCAVSIAGVTDWVKLLHHEDDEFYEYTRLFWRQAFGDEELSDAALKAISPVNFAAEIKTPVLIIQGKEDRTVPPDQARALISALKSAGAQPESVFLSNETHALGLPTSRLQAYGAIERFLRKYVPARAP